MRAHGSCTVNGMQETRWQIIAVCTNGWMDKIRRDSEKVES